ncbi:phosphopantetheine-binding protein [Ruminiclostridium papyrosolvens DSM 2782]|uniref:Phosphopantetheine-binding protein n=1 Tax=Ruminiclostridium papyrosolvens DSM 2782 TaxID=588581 RepID=F1T8T3_9FIRM|nr:phosphopantetheine-binding protein [Ruminiclostridium papyrosolvens]EGD48915.1 phosphopantetheine-binding protein [Ruminiclostridium papyrosolvens DSM 2782]WES35399.1 phosphopantetheine-binding protein [Ruminiclostridium papyrosolvens DSM 2782]
MNDIKERVMKVIAKSALLNADNVTEKSWIGRDHGIDSIRLVEMIINLEDEFDIEVDTSSLSHQNFANVDLITEYVTSKLESR